MSICHGRMYVFGGNLDNIAAERYDPSINLWVPAKAPKVVSYQTAAVTFHGFLYVIGGRDKDEKEIGTVQKYNPETNLWQEVSPLSSPRSRVCAVSDGSYIIICYWRKRHNCCLPGHC